MASAIPISAALLAATLALDPGSAPAPATPPPLAWESVGLGAGGGLFRPSSSPHDPDLMFVSCDMSGLYRSDDGGASWRMIDFRQVKGNTECKVAYHPRDPDVVYFDGKVSKDQGFTWQPLSESPPPGQVVDILIDGEDSSLVLFGTSDGLFVSRDGGKRWERSGGVSGRILGLHLARSGKGATRRILAATAAAIFRSDDDGATFDPARSGLPDLQVRDLDGGRAAGGGTPILYCTVASEARDGKLVGGIYRTTDLGESWQPALGEGINRRIGKIDAYGDGDLPQYHALGVAEDAAEIVYVTGTGTGYWPPNHTTVFRSDDGGKTWRHIYNRDFRMPDLNVDNGWIPYALTWIWWGFHTPGGFDVNPEHPDTLMWADGGSIDISRNGGRTWKGAYSQYAAGQPKPIPKPGKGPGFWRSIGLEVTAAWNYRIDPHDRRRHFICYNDVGMAYSVDGGVSWCNNSQSGGSPWTNATYDLRFDPEDKGLAWAAMSMVHDIPHWTYIHDQAKGKGGVCVSRDGGVTWKRSSSGLPEAPVTSLELDPKSPAGRRALYAAVYDHGIFKSVDGGKSWKPASGGIALEKNPHTWIVKLHPDGTLFCGVTARRMGGPRGRDFREPGAIYRSRDGGMSWEDITRSLSLRWPNEIAVHPRDSSTIYLAAATAPGHAEGGIYKTTDGGNTWKRLLRDEDFAGKGGPDFVQCLFVTMDDRDPGTVYLGTEGQGLWVTHDEGASWKQVPDLPFCAVQRVAFDPGRPDLVYVLTFGGGIWKGPRPRP